MVGQLQSYILLSWTTMDLRKRWTVAALALVLLLSGCSSADGEQPLARSEAEVVLEEVVSIAVAGNFDALCEFRGVSEPMCRKHLALAQTPAPTSPPQILADRSIASNGNEGLVLRLCGEGSTGEPYVTDFVVWRTERGLEVQDPVYWSGILIQDVEPGRAPIARPEGERPACQA